MSNDPVRRARAPTTCSAGGLPHGKPPTTTRDHRHAGCRPQPSGRTAARQPGLQPRPRSPTCVRPRPSTSDDTGPGDAPSTFGVRRGSRFGAQRPTGLQGARRRRGRRAGPTLAGRLRTSLMRSVRKKSDPKEQIDKAKRGRLSRLRSRSPRGSSSRRRRRAAMSTGPQALAATGLPCRPARGRGQHRNPAGLLRGRDRQGHRWRTAPPRPSPRPVAEPAPARDQGRARTSRRAGATRRRDQGRASSGRRAKTEPEPEPERARTRRRAPPTRRHDQAART